MKKHDHLKCTAPICCDDPNKDYKSRVIWIPGEGVCDNKPYQKFQKIQLAINKEVKKGTFKHTDRYYTADELENNSI